MDSRRGIGFWEAAAIGVGGMVGGGIFAVLVLLGVATYWAAPLVIASWAGQGILRRIWPSGAAKRLWPVALGVLILAILVSLPWVGGLIRFAIVLFGLGAITLMFKTWWQNRPRMVPEEPPPAWF